MSGPPALSIIVPTFKEAENLPVLVPRLGAMLQSSGIEGEILVVDDASGDGTEEACARLAAEHPLRLLVRRGERGLSGAVLRGLAESRGSLLVVMDADLSHPPEAVPELVAALADPGVDFVVGSRYVPGASTDERWGFLRWVNSRIATLLARPLTKVRDPMSGFFALRRETFERAAPLSPIGYKIGLELIVKCGCRSVREVPIHFRDRLHGRSKLGLREQLRYLRHLARLYRFRLF